MSDRDRRVRAEWGQIQSAGRDLEALADLLGLEREDLESQLEPLKLSVEEGCLEYKRNVLNSVFRELENERFKSLSSETLDRISRDLGIIVYVTTIQRLLADGQLPLRDHQARQGDDQPAEEESTPSLDVKEIIADVQQRVKDDPDLRTNQPIKNVLMQLSRYSKEVNDFRELTARIPREKAAAVGANFQKTTDEIFASIRKNYEQYLADEQAALPKEPQNILMRIDLKTMVPVYQRQARETSTVRSSLGYARNEQSGTRGLLIEIAGRHPEFDRLIEEEGARYEQMGGTPALAGEIARAMTAEISKRIQREIEYF
jgi:hypothetical protein